MSENKDYPLVTVPDGQHGTGQNQGSYDYRIFAPGFGGSVSPANDYPLVFRESVESLIEQGKKYAASITNAAATQARNEGGVSGTVIRGIKPDMKFSKEEVSPDPEQHGTIAAKVKNFLDGGSKEMESLQFKDDAQETAKDDLNVTAASEPELKAKSGSINEAFSSLVHRSNVLLSLRDSVVIPPHILQKLNNRIPKRLANIFVQTTDGTIYCRLPYVPQQIIASLNLDFATNLAQRHSAAAERLISLLKQMAASYLFRVDGVAPFYVDKHALKDFLRDRANAGNFVLGKASSGVYYIKLKNGKSFSQLTVNSQKLLIEKVAQYFKVVITCQ